MARPLSLDLRERIVAAVEGGLSRRSAASRFAVSESCAIKLVRRWQHTGSVEPGAMGHKPFALARHEKLVRDLVAAQSDLTLKKRRSMPLSKIARMSPRRARHGARISRG